VLPKVGVTTNKLWDFHPRSWCHPVKRILEINDDRTSKCPSDE